MLDVNPFWIYDLQIFLPLFSRLPIIALLQKGEGSVWGGGEKPLPRRKKPKGEPLRIICQRILYKFKRKTKQCRCVKSDEIPSPQRSGLCLVTKNTKQGTFVWLIYHCPDSSLWALWFR